MNLIYVWQNWERVDITNIISIQNHSNNVLLQFQIEVICGGFIPARDLNSSVLKGIWWMPWQSEAMKDVAGCDKLR